MTNLPFSRQIRERPSAFTLLELLLVVTVIAILASLLLPVLAKAQRRGRAAQCIGNLKQIGTAFHGFSHDHDSRFPMQVSTNAGGSMEFLQGPTNFLGDFDFAFRHFLTLSNELENPKVLVCPADRRIPANRFALLKNEHVSYFVGRHADYNSPDSILAGDRNLIMVSSGAGTTLDLASSNQVAWTGALHDTKGNLLFADARVEQLTAPALRAAVSKSSLLVNVPAPANPTPALNTSANSSAGSGGRASGPSPAPASGSSGGTLQRLETFFQGPPARPYNAPRGTSVPAGASNNPNISQATSAPPTVVVTNQLAPVPTDKPSLAKPASPATAPWTEEVVQPIADKGYRTTYWLLLLLLAIIGAMEMQRRWRKRAQKSEPDQERV